MSAAAKPKDIPEKPIKETTKPVTSSLRAVQKRENIAALKISQRPNSTLNNSMPSMSSQRAKERVFVQKATTVKPEKETKVTELPLLHE
jgi:hypothetical protein